jgi:release factor glutamine methyltransferase
VSGNFANLSVEAARRQLGQAFRHASLDSPELDARLLISTVLDLDLTGLVTSASRILTATEATQLSALMQRRLAGEPVARIIGVSEFWGLPFTLSATTLVPRPETELIVESALNTLDKNQGARALRIVDIGTGSGAILLALLSELPRAYGVGIDIDEAALRTAANNAQRLGLNPRAGFILSHYMQALMGTFDIIVSNPPYIPSHDIAGLDIEVRDHDPIRALDGGPDGLDAYRTLIPQATLALKSGGLLLMEVGQHQNADVEGLMRSTGLTLHPTRTDLAGIPRVVMGQKCGPQGPLEQ